MMDLEELETKYEEFIETLSNSLKSLNGHGLDLHSGLLYHLNKVVKMVVENAPFKKGDRVELIEDIKISKDSGWYCHKHDLCQGKQGDVSMVEVWDNSKDKKPYYVVYFVPDDQTYCCTFGEDKGKHFPKKDSYHYPIPADKFRRVGQ